MPSPTYPAPRGTSADRARLSSPAGAEFFNLGDDSSHRVAKLDGGEISHSPAVQTIAALGAQARDDLTDQPHRAGFGILTFPAERLIEAHAAEQDWRAV